VVIGTAKEYGREERPNRKCKTNEAYSHILQPLQKDMIIGMKKEIYTHPPASESGPTKTAQGSL